MDASTAMNPVSEIQAPQTDVAGWITGFKLLLTLLTLVFTWQALRFLLAAPGFELVFEEMLGDKNKLPIMARLVIENSMGLSVATLFVNLTGIVCLWTIKRGLPVCGVACALLMFDYFVFEITLRSLMGPAFEIIRQLSSGT